MVSSEQAVEVNMETRRLGSQGLEVSALGLGCMGMSWAYGTPNDAESMRVIRRALDLGVNFVDTAEIYGPWTNEELVGRAIAGRREQFVIATKFGFDIAESGERRGLNSRPDNVRRACDGSLRRLGIDHIDLFYQHRLDPGVPIEDTVGAMAELVTQGKVRYLGLSEVSPRTIRRAHAVHPVSAVQSEYSLWERGPEREVLPTLRELGIGFVPYSPLGRGFLSGRIERFEDLAPDDYRRTDPRFQGENLARNLRLVERVQEISQRLHATPGQVALAWLLHQGQDIVPIPGTKRVNYLEENAVAVQLALSAEDLAGLEEAMPVGAASGARYAEALMKTVDR
jgi:aryl-alcohol dehydrogenase-like predicted oxidoreductase